jgi:hypothetical protein
MNDLVGLQCILKVGAFISIVVRKNDASKFILHWSSKAFKLRGSEVITHIDFPIDHPPNCMPHEWGIDFNDIAAIHTLNWEATRNLVEGLKLPTQQQVQSPWAVNRSGI